MGSTRRWEDSEELSPALLQLEDSRQRPDLNPGYIRCAATLKEKLAAAACELSGRCLIAGAGRCHDVPVGILAERFAEVRLVDIREVSDDLQWDHVSRHQEDVTSVMAKALRSLERIPKNLDPMRKASTLSKTLDELAREEVIGWRAFEESDFVASTLLLSQLGRPVQTMMLKILGGFGLSVVENSFTKFLERVQKQHIRWLSERSKKGGRVFLSTTPRLTVRGEAKSTTIPLVIPSVFDEIDAHFEVEERTEEKGWGSGGRSFNVEAFVLRTL